MTASVSKEKKNYHRRFSRSNTNTNTNTNVKKKTKKKIVTVANTFFFATTATMMLFSLLRTNLDGRTTISVPPTFDDGGGFDFTVTNNYDDDHPPHKPQHHQQQQQYDDAGAAPSDDVSVSNQNATTTILSRKVRHSSSNSSDLLPSDFLPSSSPTTIFRILCTTHKKKLTFGSYKIRCLDFASWVHKCTNDVHVTTGLAMREVISSNDNDDTSSSRNTTVYYNATIMVKSIPGPGFNNNNNNNNNNNANAAPQTTTTTTTKVFGNVFVDMVDNYELKDQRIPKDYTLIFQTDHQSELFPIHKHANRTVVVEHWYNTYPADWDDLTGSPESSSRPPPKKKIVPAVVITDNVAADDTAAGTAAAANPAATVRRRRRDLRLATVVGGIGQHCPALDTNVVRNVTYSCLKRSFDIESWYVQDVNTSTAHMEMNVTMSDPSLGRGALYHMFFRTFDVLVVPVYRDHRNKLLYNSNQRATSQMRSGVPTLLEARGKSMEDFIQRYKYKCAYQDTTTTTTTTSSSTTLSSSTINNNDVATKYWTFQEAVEQIKDPNVRKECQRQALEIVKDFSPSRIGQKYLRYLGYEGEFQC